jgi:hypothetical protein
MFVHLQGCSCKCPCRIVAAFVTKAAYDAHYQYQPCDDAVRSLVHKLGMCNHGLQFAFATLSPTRYATKDCLCQHIQPPTAESH